MAKEGELIQVGRLGRTRGVDGWLWITPDTDFPDRFSELESIHVSEHDTWQKLKVESARVIGGRPLIKFVGIDTREEAARMTNRTLAIPSDQLVQLPPDIHYVFDVVGCEVHDAESDRHLGRIVDVVKYPANDVYVIRTENGKDVLFPAVNNFVRNIDTTARKVLVVSGGLFDDAGEKIGP